MAKENTASSENLRALGIVRKYMNGAVCIESPLDTLNKDLIRKKSSEHILIKRVSCSCTSERYCKIHESGERNNDDQINHCQQDNKKIEQSCYNIKTSLVDLKQSVTSLATTITATESNEKQTQDNFKNWMLKKDEEKKRIEESKFYILENKEKEKQKRLEEERENFKRWLINKKREVERRKFEKEKELENEKEKEELKERRNKEGQLRYQLWLKKKEQQGLERKIKEQMEIMKTSDDRQKRIEENEKAYRSWLENSKTKPKPLPLSRGLDSLRSSVSVTYINPVPWTPNIEKDPKPISQ